MKRVPPCLPAVLQLKGYRENYNTKKGDYVVFHYGVHLPVEAPATTKHLFFLEVGRMPAASGESIQFHMVSL